MRVGFIGMGRMGRGVAGNILAAGHDLVVYNRTREKTAELAAKGARVAETVAGACEGRDVVITMLPDDRVIASVASDILGALPQGAIHVAMGTHGVEAVERLTEDHAAQERILVTAPVLGRPDLAESGQLAIVAAGPPEAVRKCGPLFDAAGRRTFHAGAEPKAATAIKLANNFVLGCAIEAMAESFALTRQCGVAPEDFYTVLTEALFAAPAYKLYGRIIVDEAYDAVGFTAELGLKDANLILAAGDLKHVPLPSLNVFRDRLIGAVAHGDGGRDWAVMGREQCRASGME